MLCHAVTINRSISKTVMYAATYQVIRSCTALTQQHKSELSYHPWCSAMPCQSLQAFACPHADHLDSMVTTAHQYTCVK